MIKIPSLVQQRQHLKSFLCIFSDHLQEHTNVLASTLYLYTIREDDIEKLPIFPGAPNRARCNPCIAFPAFKEPSNLFLPPIHAHRPCIFRECGNDMSYLETRIFLSYHPTSSEDIFTGHAMRRQFLQDSQFCMSGDLPDAHSAQVSRMNDH